MTVKELIESARLDLHSKTDYEIIPLQTINEAVDLLFELLWKRQSHLIRSEYELDFTAGVNRATFTDAGYTGFRGLRESPYTVSTTGELVKVLLPLPVNGRGGLAGWTCIDPDYFELESNDALLVFPISTVAVKVKGDAYFHPATLTSVTDEVPFNGYFDRALKQVLIQSKTAGLRYAEDPAFMAFLEVAVNDVTPIIKRTKGIRRRVRDF